MKIAVVWAWLAWCSIARLLANIWHNIHIYEQRWNIGWNCYDERVDWICVHKFWPHILHTDNKNVWNFLNQFAEFELYQHRPLAYVDWQFVSIPYNYITDNQLWKLSEEDIYDKFMKNYNIKQRWFENKEATKRFPIRDWYVNRLFNDKYQWIPKKWYTNMLQNMVKWIPITLNYRNSHTMWKNIIRTWRIDTYYDYKFWELEYNKTKFVEEKVNWTYQDSAQVNYPNDYDFTRITEHKHRYKSTEWNPNSIITKEYPRQWTIECYPVNNEQNNNIYYQYKELADKEKNVHFLWRLATFQYLDMDKVINQAMELSEKFT